MAIGKPLVPCPVQPFKSLKTAVQWHIQAPMPLSSHYTQTCVERLLNECKVPSSLLRGPIVQTLSFQGQSRLIMALPQSVILIPQEWLTTVAR